MILCRSKRELHYGRRYDFPDYAGLANRDAVLDNLRRPRTEIGPMATITDAIPAITAATTIGFLYSGRSSTVALPGLSFDMATRLSQLETNTTSASTDRLAGSDRAVIGCGVVGTPPQPSLIAGSRKCHYPTRRALVTSGSWRNTFTRPRNAPTGSLSPRSHRASVLGSTPRRSADSFCESPRLVRWRTNVRSSDTIGSAGCFLRLCKSSSNSSHAGARERRGELPSRLSPFSAGTQCRVSGLLRPKALFPQTPHPTIPSGVEKCHHRRGRQLLRHAL